MQRKVTYSSVWRAVLVVALFVAEVVGSAPQVLAQGSAAVNAYSPYTMFGIGELNTIGTTAMRALGGVGVAWRSSQMPSMLNPAGYSATARKSFIFNFGAEANFLQNTQNKYAADGAFSHRAKNAKNTANFHEIAVQMPLAKGLGLGVSLMPYSSVGYKMKGIEKSDEIVGNIGTATYDYSGDGDVTEVKLGVGWEFVKNLSVGIAAKYYWGHIKHNYSSTVTGDYVGPGDYNAVIGLDDYAISSFKFQVGVQWSIINTNKRVLTLGATYDYGGPLRPKVVQSRYLNNNYSTSVSVESNRSQMRLPHKVVAGIMYQDPKFTAGAEYEFAAWGGGNAGYFEEEMYGGMKVRYVDTHTAKLGIEYTPNRFDVRNYLRRIAYRFGCRYSNYYQSYGGHMIPQVALTAGLGFPLKFMGASSIDVCFEYGYRGTGATMMSDMGQRVGLIKQNYFKIGLGFSLFGEDYWFVRPKFD